jgi:A/G-specific adenine glycosylase
VDANVARVFARIFCIEGDLKSSLNQRRLWQEAEALVQSCTDDCSPSQLNPALMELGALICTPREPRCNHCPVHEYCLAGATGRTDELPHATPKPEIVEVRDVCAFIQRINAAGVTEILLRQRADEVGESARNWWRGLWELPRTSIGPDETPEVALRRLLQDELRLTREDSQIEIGPHLKTLQHGVTHHRITLECWAVSLASDARNEAHWFEWEATVPLAMPSTMRRLLAWLRHHVVTNQQLPLL